MSMEYIIKVSDFDQRNNDINSIKPLCSSSDPKWSDDEDYEEQERSALTTVCGIVDQEVDENTAKDSKVTKAKNEAVKIKVSKKSDKPKERATDEKKLRHYKNVLFYGCAVTRKSLEFEKTIYETYPNHVRFSQEIYLSLDVSEKMDTSDTINRIISIADTFAKTTTPDNFDDKKY